MSLPEGYKIYLQGIKLFYSRTGHRLVLRPASNLQNHGHRLPSIKLRCRKGVRDGPEGWVARQARRPKIKRLSARLKSAGRNQKGYIRC